MHAHGRPDVYILHILWRNQDVLFTIGRIRRVNLGAGISLALTEPSKNQYHHLHANAAVDGIHEHVELICFSVNS